MLLARLFNAIVSKLLVNEYKQIAEHYGQQYRFVMAELNATTSRHLDTAGELHKLRNENERLIKEIAQARAETTACTPDPARQESAAMLVNAAIINNAAKETITKLQQQIYALNAKIKEYEHAGAIEQQLLDNISAQLKEAQKENYDLKQTILSLEEECRRLADA